MSNTITVQVQVKLDVIRTLLADAFEGCPSCWYANLAWDPNNPIPIADFCKGGAQQGEEYWHWSQLVPTVPGCAITFEDSEDAGKVYRLDLEAIKWGLQVMEVKFPEHFADAISGNDDMDTGDAFLQCCIFGDVIHT